MGRSFIFTNSMRKFKIEILLSLLIAGIVCWNFADTFHNPALFGDDYMNISRSRDLSFATHLKGFLAPNNSYDNRPLGNALYRWLYVILGVHPLPYISILLGLHLANAVLGFILALRLLRDRFLATLCVLTWALNYNLANNVYSFNVVYDNLAFFWWTAGLLLYLCHREHRNAPAYAGALICFLMATRSKEVAVMLPFSLFAYEVLFLEGKALRNLTKLRESLAAIARRLWPFFLLAGLYAVFYLRKSAWGVNSGPRDPYYMQLSYHTFMEGLQYYLSCAALEHALFRNPAAVYLCFGTIMLWAAVLRQRVIGWASLTFILTLLPVLFFVNLRQQIYLYLPLFCMSLIVAGLIGHTLISALGYFGRTGTRLAYVVVTALFLSYGAENAKYKAYAQDYNTNARSEANGIVARLVAWYPEVPAGARFYFLGLPQDLPNPDLYVLFMPRLLYHNRSISVFRISNRNELLDLEVFLKDGNFYCFEFPDYGARLDKNHSQDVIEDRTIELKKLKKTTLASWAPGGWPNRLKVEGVQLHASLAEVRPGYDSIEYQVTGMKALAVDMLYTIDGRLMPPVTNWHLDFQQRARVFVGADSQKGLYHIIGIRETNPVNPNKWIEANVTVRVK